MALYAIRDHHVNWNDSKRTYCNSPAAVCELRLEINQLPRKMEHSRHCHTADNCLIIAYKQQEQQHAPSKIVDAASISTRLPSSGIHSRTVTAFESDLLVSFFVQTTQKGGFE